MISLGLVESVMLKFKDNDIIVLPEIAVAEAIFDIKLRRNMLFEDQMEEIKFANNLYLVLHKKELKNIDVLVDGEAKEDSDVLERLLMKKDLENLIINYVDNSTESFTIEWDRDAYDNDEENLKQEVLEDDKCIIVKTVD